MTKLVVWLRTDTGLICLEPFAIDKPLPLPDGGIEVVLEERQLERLLLAFINHRIKTRGAVP